MLLEMMANASALGIENVSLNGTHEPKDPREYGCNLFSFMLYTVLVGSLCLFGIIGNLISFGVFWKDSLKTSTSFLLQALALVDSCLLLTTFPLYSMTPFTSFTGKFNESKIVEQYLLVYGFPIAMIAQTATIWVTVLVGVNRYIAVCIPYQASRLCTVVQARKQLGLVLLFAFIYNIPRFPQAYLKPVHDERNRTFMVAEHTELGLNRLYHIIYNTALYMIVLLILPLIILTVLNIKLVNALKEIKRRRAEMQSRQQQQDNNVTLVLIIVIVIYIICQLPALINQIMWNLVSDDWRLCGGFQFYFSRISNCLVILNSAVNFVIYFLFNTRFKHVLTQCCCKAEHKPLRPNAKSTCNPREQDGTTQTLL